MLLAPGVTNPSYPPVLGEREVFTLNKEGTYGVIHVSTIGHSTSTLGVMLHLCPLRSTARTGMEPR